MHIPPVHIPSSIVYRLSTMSSETDILEVNMSSGFAIRVLHEATLHDLIRARNCDVLQLLGERNRVLDERY